MDFILPSDDTMELMREEFAKMKANSFARTYTLASDAAADTHSGTDKTKSDELSDSLIENGSRSKSDELSNGLIENVGRSKSGNAREVREVRNARAIFLLLYFVKHMGYNISYGTQIFNTERGMEQLRPIQNRFGQLNDLD